MALEWDRTINRALLVVLKGPELPDIPSEKELKESSVIL
jgi:hypothetical protein